MKSKGQAAIESLMTTVFLMTVSSVVFAYAVFYYFDNVSSTTAQSAVQKIIGMVDSVYAQGVGNSQLKLVQMLGGIFDIYAQDTADFNRAAWVIELQKPAGISSFSKTAQTRFVFPSTQTLFALKTEGYYPILVRWRAPTKDIEICISDEKGGCLY